MVLLTYIGRVRDGLILATGVEGTADQDLNMLKYNTQAKMLFKKLHQPNTPAVHSVESGPYIFHYVIKENICALSLCDYNFPRKVAFAYLDDLATEFLNQNRNRIDAVTRPYHFMEFDPYIEQAKRKYMDRNRQAMAAVNSELQDVTRIMVSNIEDVLHRGEALNILDSRAADLRDMSAKYREDARKLNTKSFVVKFLAAIGICLVIFLFARFYFY
uniref:Synaptobrevin/VAMP-like protein n=1 Tax=Panagrolaimus sp. JU765 TaxID=591449 RepID=A0AC34QDS3_9BILA